MFGFRLYVYSLIQEIGQSNTKVLSYKINLWKSRSSADCWSAAMSYPMKKKIILVVVPRCCGGVCPVLTVNFLIIHLCSNDLGQQNCETQNQPPSHLLRLNTDADFVLEINLHLLSYHRAWLFRNFIIIASLFRRNCIPFCFPFWDEGCCIPEFSFFFLKTRETYDPRNTWGLENSTRIWGCPCSMINSESDWGSEHQYLIFCKKSRPPF